MSKKHHHHTDGLTEQEEQDLPVDAQPQTPQEEPAPQPEDFENFRKRTEREKAALLAYGKKDFVEKLLPAYEVMLRQQAHMQKEEADEKGSAQMQSLRAGLNMVLGELKKAFAAERIEKLDVVGKPYDPQTSEAIALVPAPADKDGQVLEEVQMGFSMEGKILRPARVVVGKAEEEAKKQEAETK